MKFFYGTKILIIAVFALNSLYSLATTYISTAPYTIDEPGLYVVTATLTDTITIAASFVTLDMNGFSIQGAPSNGITVDFYNNITIMNGFIDGTSGSGINVQNCSQIVLQKMCISNCQTGINVVACQDVTLSLCSVSQNVTGYSFDHVSSLVADSCGAESSTNNGFSLSNSCTCNYFKNCRALNTIGSAYAYVCSNGFFNVFESCYAEGVAAVQTGHDAIGFFFSNESSSSIFNCTVINCQVPTPDTGNSNSAYGIYVSASPQPCIIQNNLIHDVHGGQYSVGLSVDPSNFCASNICYNCDVAFAVDSSTIALNQYDHNVPYNAAY